MKSQLSLSWKVFSHQGTYVFFKTVFNLIIWRWGTKHALFWYEVPFFLKEASHTKEYSLSKRHPGALYFKHECITCNSLNCLHQNNLQIVLEEFLIPRAIRYHCQPVRAVHISRVTKLYRIYLCHIGRWDTKWWLVCCHLRRLLCVWSRNCKYKILWDIHIP